MRGGNDKMYLRFVIVVLFACIALISGCTTPDTLMEMSLVRGTEKEPQTAVELADYAGNRKNKAGMRAWALRSLSRLRNVPESVIAKVGRILKRENENPRVRSWAAIALGEFHRKESVPHYVDALEKNLDATTGYYILEGLSKELSVILEDTDLNERLVEAMGKFAAHQTNDMPSMYELLNEYVCNLPVVVVVLEKSLQKQSSGKITQRIQEEIYSSVYRVFVTMEMAKQKYVAGYDTYETTLKKAFEVTFASVKYRYQPLFLLTAWYSGVLGNNKELSALAADHLRSWMRNADPRLRMVVAWSLMRMDVYQQSANDSLVNSLLKSEKDERVLRLLGEMSVNRKQSDTMQQIMRIRLRNTEQQ